MRPNLALLPSNAAALPAYRRELSEVGGAILPLLIVSGLGAILGSILLLISGEAVFELLIPFLILAATILFAFGTQIRELIKTSLGANSGNMMLYAALFAFSIYGGYFGAGLGIILLALVQIMGFSAFHVANSLKNLLATSFTVLSIGVFGLGGLIAWPEAVLMMCGSTFGGYFGARFARLVNEAYLRNGVIVFGVVLAIIYFARTAGSWGI